MTDKQIIVLVVSLGALGLAGGSFVAVRLAAVPSSPLAEAIPSPKSDQPRPVPVVPATASARLASAASMPEVSPVPEIAVAATTSPAVAPEKPIDHHATLGLSYDQVTSGLLTTFRMEPVDRDDARPMFQGFAKGVGVLNTIGSNKDLDSAGLAIGLSKDPAELHRSEAIVKTFMANAVPEWDWATANAWVGKSLDAVVKDPMAQPTVTVGHKSLNLSLLPGSLMVIGVDAVEEQPHAVPGMAEVSRAIAHRAAVERNVRKTLGVTYAQALADTDWALSMEDASPADGLPGYSGSTKDKALSVRVSGKKNDVTQIRYSIVLGGESKDLITDSLVSGQIVSNLFPSWKGYMDWVIENKQQVLDKPKTVFRHQEASRVIEMQGSRFSELGNAEILWFTIHPAGEDVAAAAGQAK